MAKKTPAKKGAASRSKAGARGVQHVGAKAHQITPFIM
jgi:formyltetrahydrofolate hydrolase